MSGSTSLEFAESPEADSPPAAEADREEIHRRMPDAQRLGKVGSQSVDAQSDQAPHKPHGRSGEEVEDDGQDTEEKILAALFMGLIFFVVPGAVGGGITSPRMRLLTV